MKVKLFPVFKGLLMAISIFFLPLVCSYGGEIKLLQDFRGSLPSSPQTGDLFGNSLSINGKYFFIGSPGATPDGRIDAGALYFYHKSFLGKWEVSQPTFVIPFAGDLLGYDKIVARKDWLFVSLTGTPSDADSLKDFSGSILVFKRQKTQWNYVQTIYNPKGSINGFKDGFGAYFDSDGVKWLVVGGENMDTIYFYNLNKRSKMWELSQQVSPPGLTIPQFINVSLSKKHVLASSFTYLSPENSKVYAYYLEDGKWEYKQTLVGNSPISLIYNTGDQFGNALAIHRNWAVIGAPTDNELTDLGGAVYFFHYNENKCEWLQSQKFFSTLPSVFFGWSVAIEKNIAVVGDPGRTILLDDGRQLFQGAAVVYRRHPITWKQGERTWSPIELLIDPQGKAYDFFGGGGIDIHSGLIGVGNNTLLDVFFPNSYPNKRPPNSFTPDRGHVILYKNEN